MKTLVILIKLIVWTYFIRMNMETKTKAGFFTLASIKSVKFHVCVNPAALLMASVKYIRYNMLICLIKINMQWLSGTPQTFVKMKVFSQMATLSSILAYPSTVSSATKTTCTIKSTTFRTMMVVNSVSRTGISSL